MVEQPLKWVVCKECSHNYEWLYTYLPIVELTHCPDCGREVTNYEDWRHVVETTKKPQEGKPGKENHVPQTQ